MLDERSLALEARDVVLRTILARRHRDKLLRATIEAVEVANPGISPERVKAAIVSLLNRGILELTPEGRLRLAAPMGGVRSRDGVGQEVRERPADLAG